MVTTQQAITVEFHNGRIRTMSPVFGMADAFIVSDNRFSAVGSADHIQRVRDRGSQRVDLRGATVLPGFTDSHCHQLKIGLDLACVQLGQARTLSEVMSALSSAARNKPDGTWIVGSRDLHESHLAEGRFPSLRELDEICPRHPVFLQRDSKGFCVLNRLALRETGLDDTHHIDGVELEHDSLTGQPTGVVCGKRAYDHVKSFLPPTTHDDRKAAIKRAGEVLNRAGVTSVIDPGDQGSYDTDFRAYQDLWQDNELTVRSSVTPWVDSREGETVLLSQIRSLGPRAGFGDSMLQVGALKFCYDGEIETALLRTAHPNRPGHCGERRIDPGTFRRAVCLANQLGWQVTVHAVGGRAIDEVLAAFRQADSERSIRGRRFSLIHAFFADESNLAVCRELGIILNVQQPLLYTLASDMIKHWGPVQAARCSPHRSYLAAGVRIVGGTDCVPLDPLLAIWGLVTRMTRTRGVVGPEERICRAAAIKMYTSWSPLLTFGERDKGSIESGKLADFVVLSDDPMTCPVDRLPSIQVLATVVGGVVVHGSLDQL